MQAKHIIAAALAPIALGSAVAQTSATSPIEETQAAAFEAAITASRAAMTSNPALAYEQAVTAERHSQGVVNGLPHAIWLQAEAKNRMGDKVEPIPLLARARAAMSVQDPELLGGILLTEGRILTSLEREALALKSYQNGYDLFETIQNTRQMALAQQGIARLYLKAQRYDRAIEFFEKADATHSDDPMIRYASANNVAKMLLEMGKYDEAIPALEENLEAAKAFDNAYVEAIGYSLLTEAHVLVGELPKAQVYLASAKLFNDAPGAANWISYVNYVDALVAHRAGDMDRAAHLFGALFEDADFEAPQQENRSAHRAAFAYYRDAGDHETALRHHVAFKTIDDEKKATAARYNLDLINAEYESTRLQAENARLEQEKLQGQVEAAEKLKATELAAVADRERSRTIVFSLLTFVGAVIVVGALLYVFASRRSGVKLRKAMEEAIEANKSKDEFLATISHEIRTPLNGIMGFCEVLVDQGRVEGDTADMVRTMHKSGRRLLVIINDILDLAKMESGKMTAELAPADVREVVEDVAAANRARADEKALPIVIDIEEGMPRFVTDEGKVFQAITNLASNAIKFTERGAITISAKTMPASGFEINVRDTGIGIPSDQLDVVFGRFGQVKGQSKAKFGGTGIGLSLVKEVAALLGGDATVESQVGYGSVFTVRIPAERAQDGADALVGVPPKEATFTVTGLRDIPRTATGEIDVGNLRILYAEDNAVNVQVFEAMLGRSVGSIDIADDGDTAVEMVQRAPYDVVFLDNEMERMNGSEAATAIRALPGIGNIPIIGCTAHAVPQIQARLVEAGMDTVVSKPISLQVLVAAIKRAVDGEQNVAEEDDVHTAD